MNFSIESNYVVCSTAKGSIHVFQIKNKENMLAGSEDSSFSNAHEVKIVSNKSSSCTTGLIKFFVGQFLPVDYQEYSVSEKAQASLTSSDFKVPNLCAMDRTESKVVMFTKDAEFKSFEFADNQLVENFIDEVDGTSIAFMEH